MKAVLGFIWGVFAHHIGTKTLSLLLAILPLMATLPSGQMIFNAAFVHLVLEENRRGLA